MGIARGPNIITDGLVFGHDTGYGIANNNTATRFYPGEPAVNLFGDTSNANARPNRTEYNTSNWTAYFPKPPEDVGRVYSHTSGSLNSTWSGNSYGYTLISYSYLANTTYTLSCWVYVSSNCNITAMHQSMEGTTLTNTTNRHYDLNNKGTWQQLSISCNSSSVVNGNAIIAYPSRSGVTDGSHTGFWAIGGAKLEINTHVTPYVLGTRSDTASLIDLTRTTNIDVGDASFDSTGQPDLDGTGDFIKASSTHSVTGDITLEAVFNEDSASAPHTTVICTDTGHQYGVKLMSYKNINRYGLWLGFGSSSHLAMVEETLNNNITYHLTGSWDQSTGVAKIYLNGVLKSTQSTGQTSAVSLNEGKVVVGADYHSLSYGLNGKVYVGKVYDKVLTDAEVLQNYKAYKNRFNI
jgi:hypothetical protein